MCPNTEFFLVRIFPHSDWIRRDTKYLSVFNPNAGKYGPEKTPYLTLFTQSRQLLDFQVMSKSTLYTWCKKLGFCYKQRNKKMQVYQQLDVDIVPPICNFIKNETPPLVFSCEFFEFFQPVIWSKTGAQHKCFLVNFEKFLSLQLYWKQNSSAGVFLWILQNFWEQLFCRTFAEGYF